MANPTAKSGKDVVDFSGLALKVSQLQDASGNAVVGSQQATVADASFSDLDTTDTYTDAAVNAVFAEVETKINAILSALEDAGILADS